MGSGVALQNPATKSPAFSVAWSNSVLAFWPAE